MPAAKYSAAARDREFRAAVATRITGPGGYYNVGNMLGLLSGIAFQLHHASGVKAVDQDLQGVLFQHFAGSPGAASLTAAMIVFFISGEFYHRAWDVTATAARKKALLRRADLLSGVGALFLAVSLALFGSIWLAITSTVLLAGGKSGSSLYPGIGFPIRAEFACFGETTRVVEADLFRAAVLASRVPAVVALGLETVSAARVGPALLTTDLAQATVLLVCYGLWIRADLLLWSA